MRTILCYKMMRALFIVLLLAGCANATKEPVMEEVVEATAVPTVTLIPLTSTPIPATATPVPTNTPIPATATKTAVSTDTSTPKPSLSAATFHSTAFAEDTGVIISFQHPRDWQASHFADSGVGGWVVSDADPNDVFWYGFRTEDEPILILIMPANDPREALQSLSEMEITELSTGDKQIVYGMTDGVFEAAIIKDDQAFTLFGEVPAEKETSFQEGLEMILTTFGWKEIKDIDLSTIWLALRDEGGIDIGSTVDGYVPLGSLSEWTFNGAKDQGICITVHTDDPELTLLMDVLESNGNSLMPNGEQTFTGTLETGYLTLPADDNYTLQLIASTGFVKYMPGVGQASESHTYGWYEVSLEEGSSENPCDPELLTATTTPTKTPIPSTATLEPSPIVTNTIVPINLLDPAQLITAEDLNAITEELGIVEWQMDEEVLWEYRVCHNFTGASWSINPNHAINCVFLLDPNATFESTMATTREWEILGPNAIELESTLFHENNFALYTDMYEQAYYDAFLMGDGVLYWTSLSIGVPGGYTPETLFAEIGTEIEAMIDAILQINLERKPN